MTALQDWGYVLGTSFQNLWMGVISFVPNVVISLLIFIVGWAVGSIIGRWVATLFKSLELDHLLQNIGLAEVIERAGFRLNAGMFIGWLVKWFIIIAFLLAAFNVLGLTTVSDFLSTVVLSYIPNVIVATLMLVVSVPIAETLRRIVVGGARAADISKSAVGVLGTLTRYAVWIFALIAALLQLGIAREFLLTMFTGFVAMVALAGGLAFGLGGRDAAARYIAKIEDELGGK